MNNLPILLEAIEFAAHKHRKQRRKGGDDIPYINHPIQVANHLAKVGKIEDTDLLLAAILHDTVEDTKTTFEELEDKFGKAVRNLVGEVTDDKTLPKMERKRLQVEKASYKTDKAKMLKIADKTCNVRDIITKPPNWDLNRKIEYLNWAKAVVDKMRGVNLALEADFDRWYQNGMEQFEK